MNTHDVTALAVRGGLEAMRKLALLKLVNENPDRLKIICNKCWLPCSIDDIILRKSPGKLEVYYSGACKACRGGDTTTAGV